MIEFFCAGIPKSTQTAKVTPVFQGKGKPPRLVPRRSGGAWSALVGARAQQIAETLRADGFTLPAGAIEVTLDFVVLRPKKPKSTYPRYPDLGNTSKGILDAINGVLWVDDSQVIRLHETKRYGEQPGVNVQIDEIVDSVPEGSFQWRRP